MIHFNPKVSIVIPVYNGSNYLREAIDSALVQTYKNCEVIVINDGSVDNTEEIALSYGNKIRYFAKENGGVSTALNLGIEKMEGEYFSWLSHDDMYYPNKIERQIEELNTIAESERENTIIFSNFDALNMDTKEKTKYITVENLNSDLYKPKMLQVFFKSTLGGCTLLIPRKLFFDISFFDERHKTIQDYYLFINFFASEVKFYHVIDFLVISRHHKKQGTCTMYELHVHELTFLYRYLFDKFKPYFQSLSFWQFEVFLNVIKLRTLDKVYSYMLSEWANGEWNAKKPMIWLYWENKEGRLTPDYIRLCWKTIIIYNKHDFQIKILSDIDVDSYLKEYNPNYKKYKQIAHKADYIRFKLLYDYGGLWLDSDTIIFRNLQDINEKIAKNGFVCTTYEREKINFPIISFLASKQKNVICKKIIDRLEFILSNFNDEEIDQEWDTVGHELESIINVKENKDLFYSYPIEYFYPIKCFTIDLHKFNSVSDTAKTIFNKMDIIPFGQALANSNNLVEFDWIKTVSEHQMLYSNKLLGSMFRLALSSNIQNIHINDNDLTGNKFNGHDIHFFLLDKGIESYQYVNCKNTNDSFTLESKHGNGDYTKTLLHNTFFLFTDIIHFHLIHNTKFNLNYLPLLTKLKPTIITLHDPYFLGGHCVHHFDCIKWQTHCYDCHYLDKPFAIEHDDTTLQFELKKQAIQNSQISAIVASRWMEEKVKKSPIWQGKKVYYLPFGINQDLFKPADTKEAKKKLGISPDSFTVMFRSDPSPYKGLDIIIDSLINLQLNSNEKPTILSVAQKGLLGQLSEKYLIIEYNWVTDDNVLLELYHACDLFLMPSRQETFGMMAIEAMSCRKMVLALDCEGSALPDVINSPDCGIAVDESNYAEELQRLVDNPQEIIARGKKSLEYAQKHYNKDVYVDRIIEIYQEIVAEHKTDSSANLILEQLQKYPNINRIDFDYETKKNILKHPIKEIAEFQNFSWSEYLDIFTDEWIKEEKGVWLREKGGIEFTLENYPQDPVLLVFKAYPLVHDELQPKVDVSVYVNQCFVKEIYMYTDTLYEVEIPAELFKKEGILISFKSSNSKSPKELDKWNFEDKLAFFMYSFSLTEIEATIQTKDTVLQDQLYAMQTKYDDIMILYDKVLNSKAVRLSNKIKKIIGKPVIK